MRRPTSGSGGIGGRPSRGAEAVDASSCPIIWRVAGIAGTAFAAVRVRKRAAAGRSRDGPRGAMVGAGGWKCGSSNTGFPRGPRAQRADWMPSSLLRSCTTPGCPHLSRGGRCDRCRQRKAEAFDAHRGSAAARGYDRRWTAFSARLRRGYTDAAGRSYATRLCGDRAMRDLPVTGDSECCRRGWMTKADLVDHIVPVSGPDDAANSAST
jgi:hypothetical protein